MHDTSSLLNRLLSVIGGRGCYDEFHNFLEGFDMTSPENLERPFGLVDAARTALSASVDAGRFAFAIYLIGVIDSAGGCRERTFPMEEKRASRSMDDPSMSSEERSFWDLYERIR